MKTFKFVPSICKGEDALWEGSITLRSVTFKEKHEYYEMLSVEDDGEVKTKSVSNSVKQNLQLVEMSEKHYIAVELKRKDGTAEAKSFQDMCEDDELHEALMEVATRIISGSKVGNG